MGAIDIRLGRAGCGKSTRIATELASELAARPIGPALFWIVPGAASYAAERLLLSVTPAALRAEVTTFERLALRVQADSGWLQGSPIRATGRRLLLATVYERVLAQLGKLKRQTVSISLLDAVLEIFAELYAEQIAPAALLGNLESAATGVVRRPLPAAVFAGRSLVAKLRDICLLHAGWCEELQRHQLWDPHDVLNQLAPALSRWPALTGARLYVDGFERFTPAEREFLLTAAQTAAATVITLPATGAQEDAAAPWRQRADRTLAQVIASCQRRGLAYRIEQERLSPASGRFQAAPDLALIEAGLAGRRWQTGERPAAIPASVEFAAAQNPRVEADGVADWIVRAVREGRFAYRDIAVLAPSLDDYGPLLRDSFGKRGIPCYIDQFPSFATHPLAKLILSALDAADSSLSRRSLHRLLKSDLCGLRREEADWLEIYLRRHDVAGMSAFTAPDAWNFAELVADSPARKRLAVAEDATADARRRRLAAVIVPFCQQLEDTRCRPAVLAKALWELLDRVHAKRIIANWMVNDAGREYPLEASLHEQAWQRLLGVLDDLAEAGGDDSVARPFLFHLVQDDIHGQTLSTIPAGIEEVLVSAVSRSVGWERRAVAVMGATDGEIPRRAHERGVLQDDERAQFEPLFGVALSGTVAEQQQDEQAAVYRALTRARERLLLTYPLSGLDGKARQTSLLQGQIRRLFAPHPVAESLWLADAPTDQQPDLAQVAIWTPTIALQRWVAAMGRRTGRAPVTADDATTAQRQTALWDAVSDWFVRSDADRIAWQQAQAGLLHRTTAIPVPPALAQWLAGNPMQVNVHQLETFAACPFAHFAAVSLRLDSLATSGRLAAERGTLLHDVLQAFVRRQMDDWEGWATVSDEAAQAIMAATLAELQQRPEAAVWCGRAVRQAVVEDVRNLLQTAAVALTRYARHGQFRPIALEMVFGEQAEESLPPLEMVLADGRQLWLRGRIDRVDAAREAGQIGYRVIDYKSSRRSLSVALVDCGLHLQLAIYAAAVQAHASELFGGAAEPAAVAYVPVERRMESQQRPLAAQEALQAALSRLRMRGLFAAEWAPLIDNRSARGSTELLPALFNADGSVRKRAAVLTPDEWQAMLHHVLAKARTFASRIVAGDNQVAPYRLRGASACDHCAYSAVCQIDERVDSSLYRQLPVADAQTVLAAWLRRFQADAAAEGGERATDKEGGNDG